MQRTWEACNRRKGIPYKTEDNANQRTNMSTHHPTAYKTNPTLLSKVLLLNIMGHNRVFMVVVVMGHVGQCERWVRDWNGSVAPKQTYLPGFNLLCRQKKYDDQQLDCAAPKPWSKYTTYIEALFIEGWVNALILAGTGSINLKYVNRSS